MATLPPAAAVVPTLIPFDSHAKDALQATFSEAQHRGADHVGGRDVLLAVLAVDQGTGVLAGLGVTRETTEAQLETGAR